MDGELWKQVDAHLGAALVARDPFLEEALASNAQAGLPAIDVSPTQQLRKESTSEGVRLIPSMPLCESAVYWETSRDES